jgi:hypothetical protein
MQNTSPPLPLCNRTQEALDALLKEYNGKVDTKMESFLPPPAEQLKMTREDLMSLKNQARAFYVDIFNQTFVAGTETKPKCNQCGKFIAEHASQFESSRVPPALPVQVDAFIDPWEGVGSLPSVSTMVKDEVWYACFSKCIVTGRTTKLKVAHIIPKMCWKDGRVLGQLGWVPSQISDRCNMLLMCENIERAFDNMLWCFIPPVSPLPMRCHLCGLPGHEKANCEQLNDENRIKFVPFQVKEFIRGIAEGCDGKIVYLPDGTSHRA